MKKGKLGNLSKIRVACNDREFHAFFISKELAEAIQLLIDSLRNQED